MPKCIRCGEQFKTWESQLCGDCDKKVFTLADSIPIEAIKNIMEHSGNHLKMDSPYSRGKKFLETYKVSFRIVEEWLAELEGE